MLRKFFSSQKESVIAVEFSSAKIKTGLTFVLQA